MDRVPLLLEVVVVAGRHSPFVDNPLRGVSPGPEALSGRKSHRAVHGRGVAVLDGSFAVDVIRTQSRSTRCHPPEEPGCSEQSGTHDPFEIGFRDGMSKDHHLCVDDQLHHVIDPGRLLRHGRDRPGLLCGGLLLQQGQKLVLFESQRRHRCPRAALWGLGSVMSQFGFECLHSVLDALCGGGNNVVCPEKSSQLADLGPRIGKKLLVLGDENGKSVNRADRFLHVAPPQRQSQREWKVIPRTK